MRLRHVIMSAPYRPLSGYGGAFGALPGPESLVSGDVRGDGVNGLGPGNPFVPDFANRYNRAKTLSEEAEENYKPGTPIRVLEQTLYNKLTKALQLVNTNYLWDTGIFGRSTQQVARLEAALYETNQVLLKYGDLELAMSKTSCSNKSNQDCNSYNPEMDPVVIAKRQEEIEKKEGAATLKKEAAAERELAILQQRATIAKQFAPKKEEEEETPLWKKLLMYGVPGLALLWGVSRILKKRTRVAVAGYGRASRKRRKARR